MSAEIESPLSGSFGYVEATATWATRYLDPSGYECLLTIQAESGSEVLQKAKVALGHLTNSQCQPLHKENKNGGEKDNGKHSGETVMVKPSGNGQNPICPLHGVEMTRWSKDGRTWFSHRWDDGWCNGKKP